LNVTGTSNLSTVTGLLYIGNASGLSNLNSSNLVGNVANANVALVVSQPAQPNVTSVGILTSLNVSGTSNLSTVTSFLYIGNASGLSNLNSSNLVGNVANANVALVVSQPAQPNVTSVGILTDLNVSGTSNLSTTNVTSLTVSTQANVASANIVTANVQTLNVATPIAASTGLFMNLNATYTLNSTGNWTGNIASTITSNLYTLFAPNPVASWTTYGSNPLVTGPTANGGFRFSQTGLWAFTAVITSDQNIKTLALSSNTSDVHSNLADTNVWEYVYRIGVGQDPSVPITIPFYVDNTSKYYFLDIEAVNQVDNIHRTRYTNTASEAYTGSYVILKPI